MGLFLILLVLMTTALALYMFRGNDEKATDSDDDYIS